MSKYADPYLHEINYSYEPISAISDLQCSHPSQISSLSLTHCHLQSLEGLQQFTGLTHLNLKYNNIQEFKEIYRIANKELIDELNLEGNDIEHYSSCSFLKLKANGFTGLKYLNGRDYTRWKDKHQREKIPKAKDLQNKMKVCEQEMLKTLKRARKQNIKHQTYCYSRRNDITPSKYQRSPTLTHQYSEENASPLRDISLSNANMVHSMKGYSSNGYEKENKEKYEYQKIPLQINTSEINQNHGHVPISQPTATFASQRVKENYYPSRQHQKSAINIILENDDLQYDPVETEFQFYQRNSLRGSYSRLTNRTMYAEGLDQALTQQAIDLSDAHYFRNLKQKVFIALKSVAITNREDRPCRMRIF